MIYIYIIFFTSINLLGKDAGFKPLPNWLFFAIIVFLIVFKILVGKLIKNKVKKDKTKNPDN